MQARYIHIEERYLVTLHRRNVARKGPQNQADELMQELGEALFPVVLYVSQEAKIEGVKNFQEIKERWNQAAARIQEKACSPPTERYIGLARNNLENENTFLRRFSCQTFVQLFFRNPADPFFTYTTRSLRGRETMECITCARKELPEGVVAFENATGTGGDCRFEYVFAETGEVYSVKGTADAAGEGPHQALKQISLQVIGDRRQVKKSNRLISFLID